MTGLCFKGKANDNGEWSLVVYSKIVYVCMRMYILTRCPLPLLYRCLEEPDA